SVVTEKSVEDQDQILIGRDTSAQVTLPDPDKLVSRLHAEIRLVGTEYELADLGSRNFTYLGSTRLEAGRKYPVKSGDRFKIGNFEIEFIVVQRAAADFEQTIIDPAFVNPLIDQMRNVVTALEELNAAYQGIAPTRKAAALSEAIEETAAPPPVDDELASQLVSTLIRAAGRGEAVKPGPQSLQREPLVASSGLESTGRIAMSFVSRLVKIPWQFRHEFIGQTIVVSSESEAIFESDGEELIEFVFDPTVDRDESDRRLNLLTDAIGDVISHQVALLDGYRASVREGATALLNEVDPILLEREVVATKSFFAKIPFLAAPTILRELKNTYRSVRGEDWSVVERRTYRPAFIKAYLARMTAGREGAAGRGET
ncbi:MAG: FHA domain-containing protein, partial [Rhodothermales bacterium]|nr:FHA domain-containing protein [Rhodothermales bacterium]